MLKKQKELAQRVKKQDDLITTYESAQLWYETNKKLLTNVGIAIVIVIAAGWFYINNDRTNNEKAAVEFAKTFSYYDNGQYQLVINGIPEKNVRGLLAVVNDYGSTKYGNLAKFYLANSYFNTGDYAKAMEMYEDADLDAPILESSRIAGIGACYEVQGDFARAAKFFEQAGTLNNTDPNAAEYLSNAARNYGKAGDTAQAIEIYTLIKKEYSNSAAARDAERFLEELRG